LTSLHLKVRSFHVEGNDLSFEYLQTALGLTSVIMPA
jgi:hypothetical protein